MPRTVQMEEPEVERWPLAWTVLLVGSASGALWALIIASAVWLLG